MSEEYKISHKSKKRVREVKRKARPGNYISNQITSLCQICFKYEIKY